MAIINEILTGRYNRALQKLLSMKGRAALVQLAGEASPVFPFFWGRENRYLEDWKTFGAHTTVGAVAAQNTFVRLRNPVGSNIIMVVEGFKVIMGTANGEGVLEFQTSDPGASGLVTGNAAFDNRFNPPAAGANGAAGIFSGGNNVAQVGILFDHLQFATIQTSPEVVTNEDQQWPMLPGSAFQFRTLTLNMSLTAMIRWRERPLEDSERA